MRSYLGAVVLLLGGGVLCLVTAGGTWATVTVEGVLGRTDVVVTGRDLVPVAPAMGLVALAGIVAIYAARRLGRAVLGMLLAVGGAVVALWSARHSVDLESAATSWVARMPEPGDAVVGVASTPVLAALTAVGGTAIAVAGLLTVWRGARWPSLGVRYERPASRLSGAKPRTSPMSDPERDQKTTLGESSQPDAREVRPNSREVWDAMDRGDDPTA